MKNSLPSNIPSNALLILAEATATSIVGMLDAVAGIILTYGLAIAHISFDYYKNKKSR